MNQWLAVLPALLVGMAFAMQSGINATLRTHLDSPFQAALISFLVGACSLLVIVTCQSAAWPAPERLARIPGWLWIGGLLGAVNIGLSVILAPRLGALLFTVSVVAGQLATSVVLDHMGWLGFAQRSMTGARILGTMLVFAGVLLVAWGSRSQTT